ncbi:hypothetical protein RP20_CCG020066 [Aedes albopictus]|nr:hypothetical protein RP20_CCG020066 [Aedes albopictus]
MSLCRACGQDHTLNGAPFGSFQDHARIYFDLTAIQEDDEELAFEEVNIDEEWADLKPDLDVEINDCQQSSSVVSRTIEPNISTAFECSDGSGTGGGSVPQYFSASNLAELLQSSSVGRQILKRGSLGPLSKESRNELVGIIIDRHYEMRLPTIEEVLRQYAQAITGLFREEIEETYFLARSGTRRNHSGTLYKHILNTRRKKANYLQFIETISGNPPKTVEPPPKPSLESHFLSAKALNNLLQSTTVGRSLLSRASAGPLSKESRNELVNIIVSRHFELKFPTKQEVLEQYAEAIKEVFTDETKETYFTARYGTRRNHCGKFYYRIVKTRHKAYKRKFYEEQHLAKVTRRVEPVQNVAVSSASVKARVEYDLPLSWLERNAEPWDTAEEFWRRSFVTRKLKLGNAKTAPEVLKKYRHLYSKALGYQLIEMDFRQLAIGDSEGLRKWNFILPTLVTHLSRPYQDDMSKAIAEHLNSCSPTQDSVICGVLMLLNHELQPTKVMRNFKPSVRTAQQDVILFGVTDEQVNAKLIEREAMYALYDIPIGPVLVFRGNDFRTLTGSYEVHYEDVVYRFDSAVRAIDVLVKFSTVFGLEYSKICRRVWLFICSFIYDLPVAEQYESTNKLIRLLAPCLPEYDQELGFEEVNIDEKWADLKPAVLDLETNECQQSSSAVSLTIEKSISAVFECSDGSGTSGGPVPQYFSASSLAELLQSSSAGRQILERGSLGSLPKESRNELVGILIDRHYEMRLPTIEEVLRQYAQAITGLFRHEIEETYFLARSGTRRNHSGKLYNRISNTRKNKANYLQFNETIFGNPPETVEPPPKPSVAPQFLSAKALNNLLQTTMVGQKLLSKASAGPLSKDSRNELVTIIVDRHLELKFPTKEEVMEQYAEAITEVFTDESKDTYFIARDGSRRSHGGKLYNRIVYTRQKAHKRKLYEEQHLETLKRRIEPVKRAVVPSDSVKARVEYDLPLSWLDLNAEPWDTAEEFWRRSFATRKLDLTNAKTAPEVLKKYWHLYSKALGYQLIEMDFRQLAIGDSEGLRKWSFILPTLVAHLSRPYQDDLSKAIAEHLNSSSPTQDSVICGVLMLLNHELQPTKVMRNFKPSVRTAQQDVILFGITDEQVKAKLIEREAMYALYDIPIGPVLVFRGNDFRTLTGSYEVHYEGIVYRFDSAVRAIDVLVKFSTVFGLEYSKICRRVWLFICSFIYDLPVAEQYESIIKLKRLLAPCLPVC